MFDCAECGYYYQGADDDFPYCHCTENVAPCEIEEEEEGYFEDEEDEW